MICHIVFWKLKDENKAENIAIIKERLEALVGVIPGLLDATVGANYNGGEYDAALVSHFDTKESLALYADHPAHVAVKEFVHSVAVARQRVDFEQ